MRRASFSDLLEKTYACIEGPERWQLLAKTLAELTGSAAVEVSLLNAQTKQARQLSIPFLTDCQTSDYLRHYIQINPRIAYADKFGGLGSIYTDEAIFTKLELDHHEFTDWTRSFGLQYAAGSSFVLESGHHFSLLLHRTPKEGFLPERYLSLFQRLAPHLKRAALLSERFTSSQELLQIAESDFQASPIGQVFFDGAGCIVGANNAALELTLAEDSLEIGAKGSWVAEEPIESKLRRLISNGINLDQPEEKRYGTFRLPKRQGPGSLLFISVPVSRSESPSFTIGIQPILRLYILKDAQRTGLEGLPLLKRVFDLSNREAEIAIFLCQGERPKVFSEELGISEFTVRAHIRSLHKKLGVKSRAELINAVAKIMRLPYS